MNLTTVSKGKHPFTETFSKEPNKPNTFAAFEKFGWSLFLTLRSLPIKVGATP